MTNPTSTTTVLHLTSTRSTAKRQKLRHHDTAEHHHHHQQPLLPGLPDHIAQLCLSLVPPSTLYSVCHTWRRLIYSPSFPPFLSLYSLVSSPQTQSQIQLCSFDPISCKWHFLPPPPTHPPLHLLHRHPSFISRKLPIQSLTVAGKLILLAATADQLLPALSRPLIFDPVSQNWHHGPKISTPRRWCAAGASNGVVYVASGIGSHYNTDIARSIEKWDLIRGKKWEKLDGKLKDGKFSRDAIEAVGWKGKLCMVNVKGCAAKEGIIYDVEKDTWRVMPEGMLMGWRGPAAAMEDEERIYCVDEIKGSLMEYDHVRDAWVEVVGKHEMLVGAQQVIVVGGKVCVLCADGVSIAVVDLVGAPVKVWVVEAPKGFQAVAIHVLPRVSNRGERERNRG